MKNSTPNKKHSYLGKYFIRFHAMRGGFSYTRMEAIKAINRIRPDHISIKNFHARNITEQHCKLLRECSALWGKLDALENEIKNRPKQKGHS